MDEQTQQQLMFKLQMYEQQMENLQQQIDAIGKAIVDLQRLNVNLDDLKGKKDNEILAPIGRGIFARAKLISEELLVDVGGGNLVNKDIPETKKVLDEQVKKLDCLQKELEQSLENIHKELEQMFLEAQKEN